MTGKLFKTSSILAKSIGHYELNESTTEYGVVKFDNIEGGNISNSFIYSVGFENFGYINFYIDKETQTIKSIWFVSLKSEILYRDDKLSFETTEQYEVPFFDISDLKKKDSHSDGYGWLVIKDDEPVEVCHNGDDIVYVTFGKKSYSLLLSDQIALDFGDKNELTGVKIFNKIEVKKLVKMLS